MGNCLRTKKEVKKEDDIIAIDVLHERLKKRLSEDTPPNMVNVAKTLSPDSNVRDVELTYSNMKKMVVKL